MNLPNLPKLLRIFENLENLCKILENLENPSKISAILEHCHGILSRILQAPFES